MDCTFVRLTNPRDHLEQGALPAAGRTDDRVKISLGEMRLDRPQKPTLVRRSVRGETYITQFQHGVGLCCGCASIAKHDDEFSTARASRPWRFADPRRPPGSVRPSRSRLVSR